MRPTDDGVRDRKGPGGRCRDTGRARNPGRRTRRTGGPGINPAGRGARMLAGDGVSQRRPREDEAAGPLLDYSLLDDDALVQLLVARDVRALEALYGRYARPVFSLGLKLLGDREVVEEVVQEVFLRLWTRAYGYDPQRGKLLSWLLTITHHRAIDELRRRRGQPEVDGLQEQQASAVEADADPSESYAHVEEREAVQRALRQPPEAQRRPV